MWYWLFKYIFMGPLLSLLGRPKVEGLEYVPDSGAVILASNHLAVADGFSPTAWWCGAVITFWPRPSTSPARASRGGSNAGSSRRCWAGAHRPHRRRLRAGRALGTAERLLNEGKLLGMYPGGHSLARRAAYTRGKTGLVAVALANGRESHPGRDGRHRRWSARRAARCGGSAGSTVRFGKPMDFSRFEGLDGNRFHRAGASSTR